MSLTLNDAQHALDGNASARGQVPINRDLMNPFAQS
jgi:hypothetical protein